MSLEQERELRALIRELLGLTPNSVRRANTDAPVGALDEPFVTVFVSQEEAAGRDAVIELDGVGTLLDVSGNSLVYASCSINFYRGSALDNARKLKILLQHALVTPRLLAIGLGFISTSNVRDLTGLATKVLREERAQFDIIFSVVQAATLSVETIALVPFSLALDGLLNQSEVVAP